MTDFAIYAVTLRRLDEEQIRSYVSRENPVDCAGSFKIEGLGIALMESMEGEDYTSLIGLPLINRITSYNVCYTKLLRRRELMHNIVKRMLIDVHEH